MDWERGGEVYRESRNGEDAYWKRTRWEGQGQKGGRKAGEKKRIPFLLVGPH